MKTVIDLLFIIVLATLVVLYVLLRKKKQEGSYFSGSCTGCGPRCPCLPYSGEWACAC